MTRKILSITGTRADYGLMRPVHESIDKDPELDLHLLVTGMHFLPAFRDSLSAIENDAYGNRIDINVSDDTSTNRSMAETIGAHTQSFAPVFDEIKPDILLIQGDRGEMLAAAIVAAHLNIPVVHMSGGDRSGTIDDSIRHAITKFAHMHLPTCEDSRQNLLNMGEEDARIHIVGEPALDIIEKFKPLDRAELAQQLNTNLSDDFVLLAQHPVTTESEKSAAQIRATIEAIKHLGTDAIITAPNSDAGGGAMLEEIERQVKENPRLHFIPHLGQEKFYSLLHYAKAIVGNSSAGILESPSFKIPAINIGTRQHERLRAANIIDAGYDKDSIVTALEKALNDITFRGSIQNCKNPYGDGNTAEKTVFILKSLRLDPGLLTKWIKGFEPL